MSDVRISEDHQAFIYLKHFSNVPDEVWTDPGDYGDSRRKRLRPDCIAVTWRRINGEPWELSSLSVMGTYLHSRSGSGISVRYFDCGRETRPIEPWVTELIALAHPESAYTNSPV